MCTATAVIRRYRTLRDEGFTRAQIAANERAGGLIRVRRGVYATPDVCDSMHDAVAHGGVPACISAARHLGLWVPDEPEPRLHVWLTAGGHAYPHAGCGCREHWDAGITDGFGAPSVPRVLLQILGCCGVEAFFVAVESALRQRLLSAAGLRWVRDHAGPQGREALDVARPDADSGLESLVRWRLRRLGLTVRTQVAIPGVGRVDLVIGERLIVEVDGALNHAGVDMRHKDLVRDAYAAMWGYTTLRFDYAMVVHDWDLVERAILARTARA